MRLHLTAQRGFAVALAVLGFAAVCPSVAAAGRPVGTVTADPAREVNPGSEVSNPAFPPDAFVNRPTIPLATYQAIKGRVSAQQRAGVAPDAPTPQSATSLLGFNGIGESAAGGAFPPDVNGAVSGSFVAEVVRRHLTTFNRSGTQLTDRTLASLTAYSTKPEFDPRIVYDPTWSRWVITVVALPESANQRFFILISKGSDPGGAYFLYGVSGQCGGGNYDYPQLGMNQDAIVITGNCFSGSTYLGSRVFGVAKALIYNGVGFSVPVFSVATADSTTTPSLVYDQNPNMDLLTRNGPDQVRFSNPANAFYSSGLTDYGAITGAATPSIPENADQQGCTGPKCLIDTGDGRFQAPGVELGTELWNVATYGDSGDGTFAIPKWLELDTNTHATIQHGAVFASQCSDDFNASIAVARDERAWLNWTSTEDQRAAGCPSSFVRQEIATRLPGDPAGTFPSRLNPFTSSVKLSGNYDGTLGYQRWGSTSSFSLDPSNSQIAWSWNESIVDTNHWGTRAQKIQNG
jgi:hypothetical protein